MINRYKASLYISDVLMKNNLLSTYLSHHVSGVHANDEIKDVTPIGGGCFTPLPLSVCDEQVLPRWESQVQTILS